MDAPRCFRCDKAGGWGAGEWWGRYMESQPHGMLLICEPCRDRLRARYGPRWKSLEPIWAGDLEAQRERFEDSLFGRLA